MQKLNLGLYFTPYKKSNSEWIKDLYIEAQTIIFLEQKNIIYRNKKSLRPCIRLKFLQIDNKNMISKRKK